MKIPIFCDLADCAYQHHMATLKEMGITFVFSFMPLWLSAALIYFSSGASSVYEAILKNISNGELLIYSNSIIAPIFYIALEESEHYKSFPSKISHLLIFIIVMVFAAVCFSLQRIGIKFNSEYIVPFSTTALCVSLFIRYSSATINKWRKTPSAIISQQTADYVRQYEYYRGSK